MHPRDPSPPTHDRGAEAGQGRVVRVRSLETPNPLSGPILVFGLTQVLLNTSPLLVPPSFGAGTLKWQRQAAVCGIRSPQILIMP